MKKAKELPSISMAFHALHVIVHERDFVVRVNDATQAMARRVLLEEIRCHDLLTATQLEQASCAACAAGYDPVGYKPFMQLVPKGRSAR